MSVLTESALRSELKNQKTDRYVVSPDILITPSARQYLKDKNIELVVENKSKAVLGEAPQKAEPEKGFQPKYVCGTTGGFFEKKPEYMTQLYGNKLVYKDHPRIFLRGRLDSLQSKTLELQYLAYKNKTEQLRKDLGEVLQLLRNILRAEVLEEVLPEITLFGYREDMLREMSHHPQKFFDFGHIVPSYDMGELVLGLNSLRSAVREVELAAVQAFKKEENIERQDLLQALNRLSSGVYILMCRCVGGFYK